MKTKPIYFCCSACDIEWYLSAYHLNNFDEDEPTKTCKRCEKEFCLKCFDEHLEERHDKKFEEE